VTAQTTHLDWRLSPLIIDHPLEHSFSDNDSVLDHLGRCKSWRFIAPWDGEVTFAVRVGEDDSGCFLRLYRPDGELYAEDLEGEGGPECYLSVTLTQGELLVVCAGTSSADEFGLLILRAEIDPTIPSRVEWIEQVPTQRAQELIERSLEHITDFKELLGEGRAEAAAVSLEASLKTLRQIGSIHHYKSAIVAVGEVVKLALDHSLHETALSAALWSLEISRAGVSQDHPAIPVTIAKIGLALGHLYRYAESLEYCELAYGLIEVNPAAHPSDQAWLLRGLGLALLELRRLDEAEELIDQAARQFEALNDTQEWARTVNLAVDATIASGRLRQTIARVREVLLDPRYEQMPGERASLRELEARATRMLGDSDACRKILEQALHELDPGPEWDEARAELLMTLAFTQYHKLEYEEASRFSAEAARLSRRHSGDLAILRGLILLKLNRLEQAESVIRDFLKVRENPEILVTLGQILLAAERPLEAAQTFEDSLQYRQDSEPDHIYALQARFYLSRALDAAGKSQAAAAEADLAWSQLRPLVIELLQDPLRRERVDLEWCHVRDLYLDRFPEDPARCFDAIEAYCIPGNKLAKQPDVPTLQQVADALPQHAVGLALTFTQDDRLLGIVVTNQEAEVVHFGPGSPILQAAHRWRQELAASHPESLTSNSSVELARLLLGPILEHRPQAQQLFVSAQQELAAIPWECLPYEDHLLGERVRVIGVDRLGSLARQGDRSPPPPALLVVGEVDYEVKSTAEGTGGHFESLRTRREIQGVIDFFQQAHPGAQVMQLTQGAATKNAVLNDSEKATAIHVATHGWYASADYLAAADPNLVMRPSPGFASEYEHVRGLRPGLLCGLALAGANGAPTTRIATHPAILSADEVQYSLDLSGCSLAVLSACESNVGHHRAAQDLVTMRRAFTVAGCQNVISSLWRVDDRATRELFGEFYRLLWIEGRAIEDALWQAKMAIRNHPDRPEWRTPLFWAAWTLSQG
jgi:CHAT domain-containing protein